MSSQCIMDVATTAEALAPPDITRLVPEAGVSANRTRRARPLRVIGQLLASLPRPVWLILDAIVVWFAIVEGYHCFEVAAHAHHAEAWLAFSVFAFSMVICSLIFGLNERATLASELRILTRLVLTTALSAALTYFVIYVVLYMRLSRRVAAFAILTYLVYGLSIRFFACYAIHRIKRRLLVVGRRAACESFVERLKDGFLRAHDVVGFIYGPDHQVDERGSLKNLGTTDNIVAVCREHHIHDIVVCNGAARGRGAMNWLLSCLRMGCRVCNEATFYETSAGQILVDEITPDWFLFTDLRAHCAEYASLKRIFDVAVAIVGLCVSLPFYPLIALAIKLEDGGPVFYAQDRVGRHGAVFRVYKFRTMGTDAENGENVWARPNDPRTTRIGRYLRRTRFDEFPQFYNILIGEMSVVGPRPERPSIAMELCQRIPFWSERNLVKPGLTGWAQISFRYGSSFEDAKRKLQFDFYYLKHMSLELDVIILFRTIGTFLRGAC